MLYMNKTSAAIDTSELKDIKIEYSKGKKEKNYFNCFFEYCIIHRVDCGNYSGGFVCKF